MAPNPRSTSAARPRHAGQAEPPCGTAEGFRRTRAARRSETAEDYVELIADLIDARGEARAVDLAARLGIAQATVTGRVARLRREGLVVQKPYRSIFLTEAGRDLAELARRRHRLVVAFLRALNVTEQTAEQDAEGIEHHVSGETLGAFARLLATGGGQRAGPARRAARKVVQD